MTREASGKGPDISGRRAEILDIAARLFAAKGYRGTSMREIGEEAGVLGGSLYHHIKSKDALFVELHNAALDDAEKRIRKSVEAYRDPWDRLEQACITLAETQLDPDSLTRPMMNDFRDVPPGVRDALIARRDEFEQFFRELVDALILPENIDRSIYRNALLSQLNGLSAWYRPGRFTPREIGSQIAEIFCQVRR